MTSTNNVFNFKPTCLMIKRHTITKKLYLCKSMKKYATTSYKGSGTYWKRHINVYGKEFVETVWFCWFYTPESIHNAATSLSKMYDIVKSENWANLTIEDGIGVIFKDGITSSERKRRSMIGKNVGKRASAETKLKLSESRRGHKNPNFGKFGDAHPCSILKGFRNPAAIRVNIFDETGILRFSCFGDFQNICELNDLPTRQLSASYKENGKRIYQVQGPKNKDFLKFKGWYALKI